MALHVPNIQKFVHFNSKTLSLKIKYFRYFLLCQSNYYLYNAKRWLSHMTDRLFQFSMALSTDYVVLLHCHKMTENINSDGQQFHQ